MAVQIEEDTSKAGGHAVMTIGAAAPGADLRFSIRRLTGDPDNLGPQGWQNSRALLEPAQSAQVAGNTVIVAGPEICDHIEVDTQIEIAIPALGLRETLFWPYVAPSARVQGGATMGGVPQPAAPRPAQPPKPKEEGKAKEPEPEKEEVEKPVGIEEEKEKEPEKKVDDTAKGTTTINGDGEKGGGEKSGFRAVYAVIPLLLIALGVGAYYLCPREPTPPHSGDTPPVKENPPVKDNSPATETRAARDRLRDMNKANASADAFYEYAAKLIQEQKWEDGFLAMDIAGQKGHAKALFQLGRWYDPKTFDAKMGFSKPNPVSAAEYYKKAEARGSEEAKAALAEVCKVLANKEALPVEQAAVAADAQARFCTP